MRDGEVEVVDKTAPVVTGVKDGVEYQLTDELTKVTPVSADKDIKTVTLTKDGNLVASYTKLGDITETGKYVLTVADEAGNKTVIKFEIKAKAVVDTTGLITSFEINGEKVTPVYVEGNKYTLDLSAFKETGISISKLVGTVSEDVKVTVDDGKNESSIKDPVKREHFTEVMIENLNKVDGNKDDKITDVAKFNGATIILKGATKTSVYELKVK